MSGGGKLTYLNGDTYVGSFLNGMRHGMGIMQYAAGDSYGEPLPSSFDERIGLCPS